jgi:citrate lyase subunit beta/citryl-CoA lyase
MKIRISPRRSVLYVPGNNARALEKARTLAADALILDLEDAVSPAAKAAARQAACAAAGTYAGREAVIRVNGLDTPWGADDLIGAAVSGADAVLLPKIDDAQGLQAAARLLRQSSAPKDLALWVMAETPAAILNIAEITRADPALAVIVMGTSDLGKALRLPPDPLRSGLQAALGGCLLAARAAGLDILDGVFGELDNEAGFKEACLQGKALGFDGKTLIHPRQIAAANDIFGVSEAELTRAGRIVTAWEKAAADGQGIAVVDGQMIESLHVEEARRLLALHAAISEF